MQWTPESLCQSLSKKHNGTCVLAFSRGKDSLAAWLFLRRYFSNVVPFYMYVVPKLQFVEDSLAYYEDFFHTRIRRYPHPHLYRMLNEFVFQPAYRVPMILKQDLPEYEIELCALATREDVKLKKTIPTAYAMSMYDSISRRTTVKRRGPIGVSGHSFYPLFDWKKSQIVQIIQESGCKLGPEYLHHNRSFIELTARQMIWIRDEFPNDWEKILFWFPQAEKELKRLEYRMKYYGEKA